jgi:exodeoxyribonuclease VII small subunit
MKKNLSTESSPPLSFEKAIAELEAIIQTLESGQLPLQDVINAYKRGRHLAAICQSHLQEAQLQIEHIAQTPSSSTYPSPETKITFN